jgi:hypothetical protein
MKAPFLMKEEGAISMSLRALIQVYQEFEAARIVENTLQKADEQGINVVIPKETINFIKLVLFKEGSKRLSERSKGFIRSATCAPAGNHFTEPDSTDVKPK